jgi:hypothetical protein
MEKELPAANWKERLLFFLGRRRAVLVEGDSMLPSLKNGDGILIQMKQLRSVTSFSPNIRSKKASIFSNEFLKLTTTATIFSSATIPRKAPIAALSARFQRNIF